MSDAWYMRRDGKQRGPFTAEHLKKLVAVNKLRTTDELLRDGTEEWIRASELNWLFSNKSKVEPSPRPAGVLPRKLPENRIADLVGQVKGHYRSNPIRVLLIGWGVVASVMLLGMCVCSGVASFIVSGKRDSTTDRQDAPEYRQKPDSITDGQDALTEDFFPRKSGATWDYVHEMTSEDGMVRIRIRYDFISKSEIKEYAKRVEIVRGGNTTPAALGVEKTIKDSFTGTTAVKREGKLLMVKGGKEGGWEPWLKIDARVGESWDGVKAGNVQIRYKYKKRGTHKGIETVAIVEEMSVDGIVKNRVERLFAKNIGLLSAESFHEKQGSRIVTYRLYIDSLETIDYFLHSKGNLTVKEQLFFK